MEFDGYSKSLGVAFEHQGIQHYQYVPFFHSRRNNFERTQELDIIKRSLCSKYGVTLIEARWDCADLEGFFRDQLQGVLSCGI